MYEDKSALVHEVQDTTTDAPSAMKRADQYLQQGNKDEALYYYVKALEFDHVNKDALEKIGEIHAGKGNLRTGEGRLPVGIETGPEECHCTGRFGPDSTEYR
jgi:tetratricopeptide (TPR) repeat protein